MKIADEAAEQSETIVNLERTIKELQNSKQQLEEGLEKERNEKNHVDVKSPSSSRSSSPDLTRHKNQIKMLKDRLRSLDDVEDRLTLAKQDLAFEKDKSLKTDREAKRLKSERDVQKLNDDKVI